MDNRADATSIAKLFLGLGVGAVVIWIVQLVTAPILAEAETRGTGEIATNGTTWVGAGIDFMPLFFLFVSFFGVIAYSVYRREVVR